MKTAKIYVRRNLGDGGVHSLMRELLECAAFVTCLALLLIAV